MESAADVELDKLLQEVKRTIRENALFLERLKLESISEGSVAEDEPAADVINVEAFEEL